MLVTQPGSVAPPPPCWCGRSWQAHDDPPAREESSAPNGAPNHEYVPAGGLESEAFDAW